MGRVAFMRLVGWAGAGVAVGVIGATTAVLLWQGAGPGDRRDPPPQSTFQSRLSTEVPGVSAAAWLSREVTGLSWRNLRERLPAIIAGLGHVPDERDRRRLAAQVAERLVRLADEATLRSSETAPIGRAREEGVHQAEGGPPHPLVPTRPVTVEEVRMGDPASEARSADVTAAIDRLGPESDGEEVLYVTDMLMRISDERDAQDLAQRLERQLEWINARQPLRIPTEPREAVTPVFAEAWQPSDPGALEDRVARLDVGGSEGRVELERVAADLLAVEDGAEFDRLARWLTEHLEQERP